jgi:3-isopropylmalate/(R)-2-methylmalate dehydratase small subunit
MEKVTTFTSRLAPLAIDNIDTDQIIPARFLKTISKVGLGDQLFCDWRYDVEGKPKADFILNQTAGKAAHVLLAGDNFGCGSSREHAPWALTQYGFKAVISTSFADIFKGNSAKNSLLTIVVPADAHKALFAALETDAGAAVTVDLATQKLTLPDGSAVIFPIDEFAKQCMLNGVDELGYILQEDEAIRNYEAKRPSTVNTELAA